MDLNKVIPSAFDARDAKYQFVPTGGNFPATFDLIPHVFEVKDQLYIGSCAGHGVVEACEQLRPGRFSPLFPYQNALRNSGRWGQDGVEVRDVLNTMSQIGTVPESEYPYDPAKVNIPPPQEMYNIISPYTRYWIKEYNQLFSRTHGYVMPSAAERTYAIKAALMAGHPVIMVADVRQDIFEQHGPWQTHQMSLASPPVSIHCWDIVGWDDAAQRWLTQGSWGKGYGDGGFLGYPYEILTNDIYEAWIVSNFMDAKARPVMTTSKSKVYLDGSGDVFTAADCGLQIFAKNGNDNVTIQAGVTDVVIDANLNSLTLTNPRASYQFVPVQGEGIHIRSGNAKVVSFMSLNAPMLVTFSNGSLMLEQTGIYSFTVDGNPL